VGVCGFGFAKRAVEAIIEASEPFQFPMTCQIKHHTHTGWVLIAALMFLLSSISSPAQQLSRRLILKDGSYQTVTKYEVKGERVRYMSAERQEWEELPSSLVDWPATENYEKQRAAGPAIPEAAEVDKDFSAERDAQRAHRPEVAPGLHLPELSGLYLLDNFKGEPQLVEVQQVEGDINRNTKGNIFRGALNPVVSVKQTIELEGDHAAIFAHVAVPSIYIKVDDDDDDPDQPPPGQTASAKMNKPSLDAPRSQPQGAEQPQQAEKAIVPFDRFKIVHMKVKSGKRIVGDIKKSAGKTTEDQTLMKTTIDRVNGGWLKLTPTADLVPGEYAIIEMKGAEGMNLYVWPFSVNPNAADNKNPWTPEAKTPETPK
jgi:hypothetical protein